MIESTSVWFLSYYAPETVCQYYYITRVLPPTSMLSSTMLTSVASTLLWLQQIIRGNYRLLPKAQSSLGFVMMPQFFLSFLSHWVPLQSPLLFPLLLTLNDGSRGFYPNLGSFHFSMSAILYLNLYLI